MYVVVYTACALLQSNFPPVNVLSCRLCDYIGATLFGDVVQPAVLTAGKGKGRDTFPFPSLGA